MAWRSLLCLSSLLCIALSLNIDRWNVILIYLSRLTRFDGQYRVEFRLPPMVGFEIYLEQQPSVPTRTSLVVKHIAHYHDQLLRLRGDQPFLYPYSRSDTINREKRFVVTANLLQDFTPRLSRPSSRTGSIFLCHNLLSSYR